MKSRLIILSLISSLMWVLAPATSSASDEAVSSGTVGGGGGNASTSTPDQIRAVLRTNAYGNKIADAFHRAFQIAEEDQSSDRALALIRTLGPDKELKETIKLTTFQFVDGDCISPKGEHKDAAASKDGICFSLTRLARISSLALEPTLLILGLHEFAHIRGIDEDHEEDALLIEKWFSDHMEIVTPTPESLAGVHRIFGSIISLQRLQDSVKLGKPDEVVCLNYEETIRSLDSVYILSNSNYLPPSIYREFHALDANPIANFSNTQRCDQNSKVRASRKEIVSRAENVIQMLKRVHPLVFKYNYSPLSFRSWEGQVQLKTFNYEKAELNKKN